MPYSINSCGREVNISESEMIVFLSSQKLKLVYHGVFKEIVISDSIVNGGPNMADTKGTDWMYNQNTEINKEEYLLGKAIGKNFEAEGTMGRINAVEYDCAPPSIFASQAAHQVDLQRKLIEDPLVAIKKRELEDRRKILDNPVKMKALQEHIEDLKRQRKSKKKKKKNKKSKGNDSDSDTDLDLKLLKKIKKMEEGEGDDSDDSNSDESREPSLERKVSKYVNYNPRNSRSKSPSSRSSRTELFDDIQ